LLCLPPPLSSFLPSFLPSTHAVLQCSPITRKKTDRKRNNSPA
jgi:hypothetical protein